MDSSRHKATLHIVIFLGSIGLLLGTDQNARVLLYAHAIWLLYRMPTVWFIATFLDSNWLSSLLLRMTRLPTRCDRGKPYRREKTREPAGLPTYVAMIVTLFFMIVIILAAGQGNRVVDVKVLIPEMLFASVLGLVFWIDDLTSQQLIVDPEKAVYQNLGYNTPAMSLMLASIFIGAILILVAAQFHVMFADAQATYAGWVDWGILITISFLKLISQIRVDFSNPKGFAHLSGVEK